MQQAVDRSIGTRSGLLGALIAMAVWAPAAPAATVLPGIHLGSVSRWAHFTVAR